jgi:hypothetical protein
MPRRLLVLELAFTVSSVVRAIVVAADAVSIRPASSASSR